MDLASTVLLETGLLSEALYQQYGVDLRRYDQSKLSRKLTALCLRNGLENISGLQSRVLYDSAFAEDTLRYVSQGQNMLVSQPDAMTALRCALLPVLRSASFPTIWLAECDSALMILQFAAWLEDEQLLSKTRLYVTHANERIVQELSTFTVPASEVDIACDLYAQSGARSALSAHCLLSAEGLALRPELQLSIVLGQYDLVTDASLREFEAIVCLRALSDFEPSLQKEVIALFSDSLCNFGILHADMPAPLRPHAVQGLFQAVLHEQGLYRRLPAHEFVLHASRTPAESLHR